MEMTRTMELNAPATVSAKECWSWTIVLWDLLLPWRELVGGRRPKIGAKWILEVDGRLAIQFFPAIFGVTPTIVWR